MSIVYPASIIGGLIQAGYNDAPAIGAPGRPVLTYKDLRDLAQRTIVDLNRMGIGRNDRVAMVLPNGPEMAAAFIAVGCGATTAPLNPAYRAEEFEFYLTDLKARALILPDGFESPARGVAEKLGVPVLTLVPAPEQGAGSFVLEGGTPGQAVSPGFAGPEDVALV